MARMTGPEHYREAQQHIEWAEQAEDDEHVRILLAYAQVHATLAHAAATVMAADKTGDLVAQPVRDDWYEAAGYKNEDS
jgi:hypothetical protein